jgi:hypothetical protein
MTTRTPIKKGSKYNAKETVVDCIRFPSIAESRHYLRLRDLVKEGEIIDLRVASSYRGSGSKAKRIEDGLEFPFIHNGVNLGSYICDFRCELPDGMVIIVDCKGVRTPIYSLKRRMMKAFYGIDISEVFGNGKSGKARTNRKARKPSKGQEG